MRFLFDTLLVLSSLHSSTTGPSRATLKVNVAIALMGDSFRLSTFFENLLSKGLDYAIYPLFLYRVGADHYIPNPTTVVLLSKPWKDVQENVEINYDVLEMLLESAYDILDYLEKHY